MSTAPLTEESEPLWLSIATAAKITGLSPYVVGQLLKSDQLAGRKIGGKWYIHAEALREFNEVPA